MAHWKDFDYDKTSAIPLDTVRQFLHGERFLGVVLPAAKLDMRALWAHIDGTKNQAHTDSNMD